MLEDLVGEHPGFRLLVADILRGKHRINPLVLDALDSIRAGEPWRVIANLPYQIASPFVADLVGLPTPPRDILVMVQTEVAERMIAGPGSRDYGPLSATLSLAARVERRREFQPAVFWPRPKIVSATIRIVPDPVRRDGLGDWSVVEAFLRDAFHHRRKTLRQGLILEGWAADTVSEVMESLEVDAGTRAENETPECLAALGLCLGPKGETRAGSRRRQKRRPRKGGASA